MAVFNKSTVMRRRGFLGLSLLAIALTIVVGAVLWQAVELSSVSRISDQIDKIRPVASGVRLVLIGLVAALWPRLVGIAHRHDRIDEGRRDALLAQRWRVVGWLLVIEFVLGQNLLGRLVAITTGPVV
jgi:hypothetical protein